MSNGLIIKIIKNLVNVTQDYFPFILQDATSHKDLFAESKVISNYISGDTSSICIHGDWEISKELVT